MRCYACGQTNNDHARFCVECGASLAAPTWAPPAAADSQYAPAPYASPPAAGSQYAPTPYAPPQQPLPYLATAAPAQAPPYQVGVAAPSGAYASYGYAPAPAMPAPSPLPMAGPSLVNNVTVSQAAPQAPAPAASASASVSAAVVIAPRRYGVMGVLLRAMYFFLSGLVAGALWVGALSQNYYSDSHNWAIMLALVVTVVVILLDIMIVDRMSRRP